MESGEEKGALVAPPRALGSRIEYTRRVRSSLDRRYLGRLSSSFSSSSSFCGAPGDEDCGDVGDVDGSASQALFGAGLLLECADITGTTKAGAPGGGRALSRGVVSAGRALARRALPHRPSPRVAGARAFLGIVRAGGRRVATPTTRGGDRGLRRLRLVTYLPPGNAEAKNERYMLDVQALKNMGAGSRAQRARPQSSNSTAWASAE